MKPQIKRNAAKACTWFLCAGFSLFALMMIFHGFENIYQLVLADLVLRSLVYFAHENIWSLSDYGIVKQKVFLCSNDNGRTYTTRHL